MKNIIILYFFFSFSLSQVFSEYSYVGASQAAMVGSISSYTYNDGGLFQNPASIAGFKGNIIVFSFDHLQFITKIDTLHYHCQFMKTIIS